MDEIITGLVLADLHFGGHQGKSLYEQLKPIINIVSEGKISYVAINGDYFDTRCSLTSEASRFAIKFMGDLVRVCKKTKTKIRIIKGTLSHDLNQLETAFNHYHEEEGLDFRIYTNVGEEELFPNFKVLYVPEEYIESKKDYYADYFGKEKGYYDVALVHGAFENSIPMLKDQEYEGMNPHAPVFTLDDFDCAKVTFAGHIHTRTRVASNIMYVGSFSRFCHGEENPKGCILVVHTPEGFETKFIENTLAPVYKTKDYKTSINVLSAEQIIEKIKKYKTDNNVDNLRVIIWLEENDKTIANMAIVKEYFAKESKIKLVFKNELRTRQETQKTQEVIEQQEKFSYLMDRSLTVSDKLSLYLKDVRGVHIPSDTINKILHSDKIIFEGCEND